MSILIHPTALKDMHLHAKAAYPNEAVGFFFGKDGERREVEIAWPVQNTFEGDRRRRFAIAPEDYLAAEMFALKEGLDLLGIYHSHPDHPARPSEHDLRLALPYFSYVIVSVSQDSIWETTSWRLNEEETDFIAEPIVELMSLVK
jgi:proteasome lid subunit RPN8/RPN11